MLNKYNDFILEKKVVQLLLENDLMASNDFLDRLASIKNKSKIAEILHKSFIEQTYVSGDVAQNWVDVTDKDDLISFLPDKKADKIDDWSEESPFTLKGRGDIKIGRFAKAFLTNKSILDELSMTVPKLTDKDYEDFVNLYKSSNVKSTAEFELVKGDKIQYYYDGDNYKYGERGQLGNSCMRYDSCQDYFGIYTENPDVCQLLVLLQDGQLIGRALVWKLSKSPCDATHFMDRVYTASDSDIIKFNNYCDKEGWMRKYKNSCDGLESYYFIHKGQTVFGEASVKLKNWQFDEYPFVDTLSWMLNGTISNIGSAGADTMTDTSGTLENCYTCHGDGSVEDKECSHCDARGMVECENCESSGCKKCDNEGEITCTYCEDGYISGPCPDCAKSLERDIKEIVRDWSKSDLVKMAKDYWDKLKSESKPKKKEKKEKKESKKKK